MPDQRRAVLTGTIIAERTLQFSTATDSAKREVLLRMAAPELQSDGCWLCYWEIACPDDRKVRYAAGIDGFQAIDLAIKMIGVTLEYMVTQEGYRFAWQDAPEIGFPEWFDNNPLS